MPGGDVVQQRLDLEVKRLEALLHAEIELRRARREDDLRAMDKAERSIDRRLESMNQFREALNAIIAETATRHEVDVLRNRVVRVESFNARLAGAFALVMIAMPLLTIVIVRHWH